LWRRAAADLAVIAVLAVTRTASADAAAWEGADQAGHTQAVGQHLIIDLHGASRLDDLPLIRRALQDCVQAAGATLLHIHLHRFEANGGISGVAVLAESHIALHTWPESGYAAFDVFMCGQADPHCAVPVLRTAFRPSRVDVRELTRGPGASSADE
jgi:S-adenosylmethionine decarboxylase